MSTPPPPPLDRTPSNHARYLTAGVRCFERNFEGCDKKPPVKMVVFDCDETLTVSTFMPKNRELRQQIGWIEWADYIANVNFESPFVEGSRIEKMGECLANLKEVIGSAEPDEERSLTILTRNESGAIACLNLLIMAKLDQHFDAIWSMHATSNFASTNACYKSGSGKWVAFNSPVGRIFDHKADALLDVCKNPREWFPQLGADGRGPDGENMKHLLNLQPESIVLVDDVRTNFQSPSPSQPRILRYCKVARFDSEYREMGLITNMGGLGARNLEDYSQLEEFVRSPWRFKEAHCIRCSERHFEEAESQPPVSVVVFDFDETLSMYTFMPEGNRYKTEIGYETKEKQRLVTYNFHTPYVDGDRVQKMENMLKRLADDPHNPRTLAILTKNEDGAVAVLNLLLMAKLADRFSAIWTLGAEKGVPNGVYRDSAGWKTFALPLRDVDMEYYKAFVLKQVASSPGDWFPQLDKTFPPVWAHLKGIQPYNIVLVDDERANFQTKKEDENDDEQVLRYCKVGHYDDVYHEMGLLVHMGGIGAKSDKDYDKLVNFVDHPWDFRMSDTKATNLVLPLDGFCMGASFSLPSPAGLELERRSFNEEDLKTGQNRLRKSLTEGEIVTALAGARSDAAADVKNDLSTSCPSSFAGGK